MSYCSNHSSVDRDGAVRSHWPAAAGLLLATLGAGAVLVLLGTGCTKEEIDPPPLAPLPAPPPALATNVASASAQVSPELRKLVGRWERPDGGYILEITNVQPGGKLEAGYFNPRPINVSKAEAKHEAGATRLFIELRDTGYPGCTYNLIHDPNTDSLIGKYFQAAMREEYDVGFTRLKQ